VAWVGRGRGRAHPGRRKPCRNMRSASSNPSLGKVGSPMASTYSRSVLTLSSAGSPRYSPIIFLSRPGIWMRKVAIEAASSAAHSTSCARNTPHARSQSVRPSFQNTHASLCLRAAFTSAARATPFLGFRLKSATHRLKVASPAAYSRVRRSTSSAAWSALEADAISSLMGRSSCSEAPAMECATSSMHTAHAAVLTVRRTGLAALHSLGGQRRISGGHGADAHAAE
jgi:hypothetical protein